MKILIIGSGGREDALYQKIKRSNLVELVYILPGNGGSFSGEQVRDIDPKDFKSIAHFADQKQIQLIIVGPEEPLASGIKDFFSARKPHVMLFGPDKNAAQLEASKAFAVEYMQKNNIPTAKTLIHDSLEKSLDSLKKHSLPIVLKVDGLAFGKGVSIHSDRGKATQKLYQIFNEKIFGNAGERILIQKYLKGREASLFAISNGQEAVYLPHARDHKAVFEGDKGPNTGGMGAYCPGNVLTNEQIKFIDQNITQKILRDFSYKGVLYIGLMVHSKKKDDLSVVEFNCRFGDPEIQCILPLLESDIVPYFLWSSGRSKMIPRIQADGFYWIPHKNLCSVSTVLAAKGYPNTYEKDIPFTLPKPQKDIQTVHASTCKKNDFYLSTGGRILNIIACGENFHTARKKVYDFIESFKIANPKVFEKFYFRRDIALEMENTSKEQERRVFKE